MHTYKHTCMHPCIHILMCVLTFICSKACTFLHLLVHHMLGIIIMESESKRRLYITTRCTLGKA